MMIPQQQAGDPFLWAKEPIFMRISVDLKSTGRSIESLFKNATIKSDPTKINSKNFLLILKRLDSQIAVPDIDALIRLLQDSNEAVDLVQFYKIFALYTEGAEKAAQIVTDKILLLISNYLQDQSLPSVAELLDAVDTDINGIKKKTLDERMFEDFMFKKLPMVTPEERAQFIATFRFGGLYGKLDIEELDRQIASKRVPEEAKGGPQVNPGAGDRRVEPSAPLTAEEKTYESMMEQVRVACAQTFADIYQEFKEMDIANAQLIGKQEFEEGLRKINVNLDSEDIEKLFVILDSDRDSKISYLDLATSLEKYSIESPKSISKTNELYPIFLRIRQYIKDRKGMGLQKVFRREMMKTQRGRLYLQPSEFRNGLTAMKIFLDNTMYKNLEKFLDVENRGMVDFLFFCENLGYIHRPDAENIGRPGTASAMSIRGMTSNLLGVSSVMGVIDQSQFIKAFLLRLAKVVNEQKLDLNNRFMEYDMTGTGVVDVAEFRFIVERVAKEFSGSQLRKVAEKYALPGKPDRIDYRVFIEDMGSTCKKVRIINKAFSKLYHYMIETKQEDLFAVLEANRPGEDKTFDKKKFAEILEEYCEITPSDADLDLIIKEFDTRNTGKVDVYEFVSQYKEYVKRGEDQGNIKRPDPEVVKNVLTILRDYCDKYGIILMDVFNKYNTGDRRMTQFEFHTALRDLTGETQLSEAAIHQMSAEITNVQGTVDLNLLCRMYNEYFGRSEETLDAVQTKKELEAILRKIVAHSIKVKRPVEDVLYAHDIERYGTITRADMMDIFRNEFNLEDEKPDLLRRLLDMYDQGKDGIVRYTDLLNDLRIRVEEQMGCQKLLSKLKGHLIVNGIYIHDKFIVEDFLHEKFLHRDQIHKILQSIGFVTTEFAVDQVLNQLPRDLNGKVNYVAFEEAIIASPDVFFEDEQAPMIRPDKIVPPFEVMEEVARKVASGKVRLAEILEDHDYAHEGKVGHEKLVEILLALQVGGLNKYDMEGLADLYAADTDKKAVDYHRFLADIQATCKKYEVPNEKTGLQWAEGILEEMAIMLYVRGKDCAGFFEECGYGAKAVAREEFMVGLERLGVRIEEANLRRMMKELDKEGNGMINVRELSNLVTMKSHQARAKYERGLFQKIYEFAQAQNMHDMVSMFRQHDAEGMCMIQLSDFENELKLNFGGVLDHFQIAYLLHKYMVTMTYVNYPAFDEDIRRSSMMVRLGEEFITILDKLREGARVRRLDLLTYFDQKDKSHKGTLPTSVLLEAFPPDLLTGEEQTSLGALLDPHDLGLFEYRRLLELLWIEDVNPKTKEAAALSLNQSIATHCRAKGIDLESTFIRLSKDRSGYLSSDDIKQGFDSVGVKLSYTQLSALLYFQPISTDVSGRKSYIDLLIKLFGTTNADKRLALIAGQSTEQRNATGGDAAGMNNAAPIIGQGAEGGATMQQQPQGNPLEEYKSYKPEAYTGYRSIFQKDLMERILKYVLSSRINLMEHFKSEDRTNSGAVSKQTFFEVLAKLNIELNEKDQNEVLLLPGVLENLTDVHYIPFINSLMEKDYQLRKEGDLRDEKYKSQVLPSVATMTLKPEDYSSGNNGDASQIATELKEMSLTDEELKYVSGLLRALKLHLENSGLRNVKELFGKYDEAGSGSIALSDFVAVIMASKFQFADPLQLSMMYSYLKENKPKRVSLFRLYSAVTKGGVMAQYKSGERQEYLKSLAGGLESLGFVTTKLAQFMKTNGIPPAKFREFARTDTRGRLISKQEFYRALQAFNYPAPISEADLLFASISNVHDGEQGSVPKLIDLVAERTQDVPGMLGRLDARAQRTLELINEHLKETGTSLESFASALDVNQDGYITYDEFVDGAAKARVAAGSEELVQLAQAIDSDGNKFISINELSAFLVNMRKTAAERKKDLGVDEMIKTEIDKLFMRLDEDRDGKISQDELYRGLFASRRGKVSRAEVGEIMRILDANGNGFLDREEFREYLIEQIKVDILDAEDTMEDLLMKFKRADIDGNGWLNTAEVYELIKRDYPNVKLDELLALIEECDTNKDMRIDIDEFMGYFSRSKIQALSMKKSGAVLNGVMAIKAQRRMMPSDFMNLFDRVAKSELYFAAFLTGQNLRKANLPAEGFTLRLGPTGMGYVDIEGSLDPEARPTCSLAPIVPAVAGYLIFGSATGVPIPLAASFDRKQIVNRSIKLCFFNEGTNTFIHNTAVVAAEWNDSAEGKHMSAVIDVWSFNGEKAVGSNPVVFKWASVLPAQAQAQIKVVLELILTIRKEDRLVEVSNGWAQLSLEQLKSDKEYALEIRAGNPTKPAGLDPDDVRTERKGFFSTISRALGSHVSSQLTIRVRTLSRLDKDKEVGILLLPGHCLVNKKLLAFYAQYRKYLAEVVLKEPLQDNRFFDQDLVISTFPSIINCPDILAKLIVAWDAVFQKSRKSEAELRERFKEIVHRLYCVINSPVFQSGNLPAILSSKGFAEVFDRRCELIDAALNVTTGSKDPKRIETVIAGQEFPPFRIEELRIRRKVPDFVQYAQSQSAFLGGELIITALRVSFDFVLNFSFW